MFKFKNCIVIVYFIVFASCSSNPSSNLETYSAQIMPKSEEKLSMPDSLKWILFAVNFKNICNSGTSNTHYVYEMDLRPINIANYDTAWQYTCEFFLPDGEKVCNLEFSWFNSIYVSRSGYVVPLMPQVSYDSLNTRKKAKDYVAIKRIEFQEFLNKGNNKVSKWLNDHRHYPAGS